MVRIRVVGFGAAVWSAMLSGSQRAIHITVKAGCRCNPLIPISSFLPLSRLLTLPELHFRPVALCVLRVRALGVSTLLGTFSFHNCEEAP